MKKQTTMKRGQPNVILLDPEKGWYPTYRENPPGDPLQWRGLWVHLCTQTEEGMKPVDIPPKVTDTPERVYGARNWPEVRILFGIKNTWLEKLDRGLWLGALGILAFLTFLLVASLLG